MCFCYDFLIALRLAFKAGYLRMVLGLSLVLAFGVLLSAYFGGRQPVAVGLDVGFSVIRLLLPLMIVLLAQELLSREFDRRYYLASFTYPRARSGLLLGRFAAVLVLILVALVVLSLLQFGLVYFVSGIYPQATPVALNFSFIIVVAFIWIDLVVLAALAALLAVIASTPSFVLVGTFGFMLVARSYGAIINLLSHQAGLVSSTAEYRAGLSFLNYLLPDLGALDIRMFALYGKAEFLPSDWSLLLLNSFGYALALLMLAVWLLQRKRFV